MAGEKGKSGENSTFDFEQKTWASDFTLVVEGKRLFVSKAILGIASPVFATMFQSDFKESTTNEMELPGKSYNNVLEFLRCVYPDRTVTVDRGNVFYLLPLFDEYQMINWKSECAKLLLSMLDDKATAYIIFQILQTAEVYGFDKIRNMCVENAANRPLSELREAKVRNMPSFQALAEIFEKKSINLEEAIRKLRNENCF